MTIRSKLKHYRTFKPKEIVCFSMLTRVKHYGVLQEKLEIGRPARVLIYTVDGTDVITVKPTKLKHTTKKQKAEFALQRFLIADYKE